jgi:hypothetical protein
VSRDQAVQFLEDATEAFLARLGLLRASVVYELVGRPR